MKKVNKLNKKGITMQGFIIAMILVWGSSCGSVGNEDETKDESTTSETTPAGYSTTNDSAVSLMLQGSAPQAALAGSAIDVVGADGNVIGSLNLSVAQIVLERIHLNMEGAHDDGEASTSVEEEDDTLAFKGPYLLDLLTNVTTPSAENIMIPAGTYKEIELRIHKADNNDLVSLGIDELSPIYKNSIYLEGTYTAVGQAPVNFSMSFDLSEDFKLRGEAGIVIEPKGINDLVVAFRMAQWFKFNNAKTNSNSVSFVDLPAGDISLTKDVSGNLAEVRKVIKENIKASADFGKDQDGDGQLSNDEDAEDDSQEDDL